MEPFLNSGGRFPPPNSESGGNFLPPIKEILLKYSLDLPYTNWDLFFTCGYAK